MPVKLLGRFCNVTTAKILCIQLNKDFWCKLHTSDPRIFAPFSRNNVRWLIRLILPVSQRPAGMVNCAPSLSALLWRYCNAFSNAFVFSVLPSPTAPKSVIETLRGRGFPTLTMWAQLCFDWQTTMASISVSITLTAITSVCSVPSTTNHMQQRGLIRCTKFHISKWNYGDPAQMRFGIHQSFATWIRANSYNDFAR